MIRHLFKLVWNRKRTHILIMLEIFLSFVVVFALLVTGLYFFRLYQRPLGYEYVNVWSIYVDRETGEFEWSEEEARTFRHLRHALEGMPEVESVASAGNRPFSNSQSKTSWEQEGRSISTEVAVASSRFDETLGLTLMAGRWFEPEDHALDWDPVVVDRLLAEQLVGDGDPLGMVLEWGGSGKEAREPRVVGVITSFLRGGHFDETEGFMFSAAGEESDVGYATNRLIVRVAPGTPADFEERMLASLQNIGRGWTFTVSPLEEGRKSKLRERLVPLAVLGTIGGFLLTMVVLGLTGVMWQNVVRRTREIGLRRAAGAARTSIHRQIVLEVMITASFGVLLGIALGAQVPVIGPFGFVPPVVIVQGLVISAVFILSLAALCGLYPGWSATRIQPAEALHYE